MFTIYLQEREQQERNGSFFNIEMEHYTIIRAYKVYYTSKNTQEMFYLYTLYCMLYIVYLIGNPNDFYIMDIKGIHFFFLS